MKNLLIALICVMFQTTLFASSTFFYASQLTTTAAIIDTEPETFDEADEEEEKVTDDMKPISRVKIEEYINLHGNHNTLKVIHKEGTDAIFIKWPSIVEDLHVTLFNDAAKKISNQVVDRKNTAQLEIGDLDAGEYYLVVKSKAARYHITYLVDISR